MAKKIRKLRGEGGGSGSNFFLLICYANLFYFQVQKSKLGEWPFWRVFRVILWPLLDAEMKPPRGNLLKVSLF